jgi:hypothetical protein
MSDEEKKSDLTERQRKFGGWTDEAWERYVAERNGIASKSIFDRISNINPRTGKPRRTEKFEGAAYGWNPQNFWRRDRGQR